MKTYTEMVTRREGEWFVPIDYSYNWKQYNVYPNNSELVIEKIKIIEEIEQLFLQGKKINIWYDSVLCGELLNIGMYDGWPYWKPTPAVLLKHWFGSEAHFWYEIRNYKIIEEKIK